MTIFRIKKHGNEKTVYPISTAQKSAGITREITPADLSVPKVGKGTTNTPAARGVKLPRSNIKNAKGIYKDIRTEDKKVGKDIKQQDFVDIPFQDARLALDAKKETQEAEKLAASQGVRGNYLYTKQANKISARETSEQKKKLNHENKMSKRSLSLQKKQKQMEKKERRRDKKRRKLTGGN
jgi:hypothetical protein